VLFDGVLGLFAYLILSLKFRRSYAAAIGVLVILFAPTIVINGSAWGQADAVYAAFCLGSLYFLLKERPAWACLFFGLAISFKLQAIFFLPILLVLALRRKLPLRYLALIPAVFLLMLLPAFIAGRDAWSLLTIYFGQITGTGTGIVGQFTNRPFNGGGNGAFGSGRFNGGGNFGGGFSSSSLTLNAPSIYQWFPANAPAAWQWLGITLAALVVVAVGVMLLVSKKQITSSIILKVALVFAIAIPFLLPEMHERYFYLADLISIIYAFYVPRRWFIAVIMQLCSLFSYMPYLINTQIISLGLLAFGVLAIAIVAFVDLVMELLPGIQRWRKLSLFVDEQVPASQNDGLIEANK
ncbi:MAG TPA: glycosyltransferase 87 family protein, partial [Chthonomonadales bacterium]|nr:glycosyltransferase 87 family protein [Chthonomonadales bacterium]